jgi:hypothetical protein
MRIEQENLYTVLNIYIYIYVYIYILSSKIINDVIFLCTLQSGHK